jgi:hypothetical protein
MFSSLIFLLFGQFALDQIILSAEGTGFFIYYSIVIGLFTGLLISIILNDRINNQMTFIYYILLIAFSTFILQVVLILLKFYSILHILTMINTSISLLGALLYFKLFLIKTSILERGRIWAYYFALLFIEVIIFICMIFVIILAVIPFILIVITIVFLHNNLDKSTSLLIKPIIKKKGVQINTDLIKYLLFYVCFGLTAGFATSGDRFMEVANQIYGGDIIIILFLFISGIVASIILGIIFDFTGRTGTLSFILLAIALATYAIILQLPTQYISDIFIVIAYIAAFMSVLLLVGDTSTRENYGKNLSIFYIFLGAGLLIGSTLRAYFEDFIIDPTNAQNLIIGTTFMACILCYIFLVSMKETLPWKEQVWKDFLIHLYILHKSGMLLYEKSYLKKEESDSMPPLVISGGFIGLITMLQHIVKSKSSVRTIDHGDRKLVFKFNNTEKIIFVLLVKEDLFIYRKKVDALIEVFDQHYIEEDLDHIGIGGFHPQQFEDLNLFVKTHFG